jgi:rhomboid protease GluP
MQSGLPPVYRQTFIDRNGRLSFVLIGILAVIWLAVTFTGGSTNSENLIRWGANYAPLVREGDYWRLLTANWLHIGSAHLFFNGYALFAIGPQVERYYGRKRFLSIYLLSGVCGAIFSYALTQGLSAGASTSIFGLFGALVVYFYRQRDVLGEISRQQLINLGISLALNVMIGLAPGSNIDNWGHFGGFVGGVAVAWFLMPRLRTDTMWRALTGRSTQELPQLPVLAVALVVLIVMIVLATGMQR